MWRPILGFTGLCLAAPLAPGLAQVPMPDVREMSGTPLPSGDLPDGTVSIRLIRGSLSNNLVDHQVELTVGRTVLTARTGDDGRAQFSGLQAGAEAVARATVGAEVLESQRFAIPARGGIRMMLVAAEADAAAAAPEETPAARPGLVVLGGSSRFVIELADDAVVFFALVDVVSSSRAPVTTTPLVFELPPGARGATMLQGSTAQASVADGRVMVGGPFQPGTTAVQFAYELPYSGDALTLSHSLPAALQQVQVLVQATPDLRVESPQLARQRQETLSGESFVVADGPGLPADATLTIELTGLPHRSRVPRGFALALALAILIGGAWLAADRSGESRAEAARRLARRDTLLGELVKLEQQFAQRRVDEARYRERRVDLVGRLERIYAEIDREEVVAAEIGASREPAPARRTA